jgi:beta-lactamase superfamily II metal-dependent hydrolase
MALGRDWNPMFEIDFLAVGDDTRSGDAITMRFNRPDTGGMVHVIIDAGFQSTGDDVVAFVEYRYGTRDIDLAILTHPDGDHIGGMGTVIRELNVAALALHRLSAHGGSALPAAKEVDDLCEVAGANGTEVYDAFEGLNAFGRALLVAGPTQAYYQQLVQEQLQEAKTAAAAARGPGRLVEAIQKMAARTLTAFPIESNFDDAGGTNPRNNSCAIVDVRLAQERFLFTADAGVPAINDALDYLDSEGRTDRWPDLVQVPHHGSRHNLDRATVERIAGPRTDDNRGSAFVSISQSAASDPRYPSPRVTNAFGRRGYFLGQTAGQNICTNSPDAPNRPDYSPLTPIPPKDETIDVR